MRSIKTRARRLNLSIDKHIMKLAAFLTLAQTAQSYAPSWWTNYSSDQRLDFLGETVSTLFETHFPQGTKLQRHVGDMVNDMRKIDP